MLSPCVDRYLVRRVIARFVIGDLLARLIDTDSRPVDTDAFPRSEFVTSYNLRLFFS